MEQGFKIYADSGRTDLVRPDLEATVAWFQSFAPDDYAFVQEDASDGDDEDNRFERIDVRQQAEDIFAKTSHVLALDSGEFLLSELHTGNVSRATLHGDGIQKSVIAKVADPVHVESSDLDGDGVGDYVVADIGFMNPSNQRYGTLWWVHPSTDENPKNGDQAGELTIRNGWETVPLKTGYSRVCDARPIDYDQDGDQDLVVAEFGFIREGSIHLLTNVGSQDGIPRFESKVVDERNGSIHVPVVDLNGDGLSDFLTLISQEHETIEAHLNLGGGRFERKVVHVTGDPAYASSGIEVVDLDGDGDLDVLYTNGDTFDDHTAKPFHSVQWLENEGTYPFTHHHLTSMPGVYRAVAGDIDLDGDMDIVAVALISRPDSRNAVAASETHDDRLEKAFDGVIWLEQTEKREFIRHRILAGKCVWATCELIELDQDQDLDLVLGRFIQDDNSTEGILLYRNQTTQ
ncbi:MAG: FG-GAP repeat domain-containing protein [Rubripirellula sp.]